MLHLRIQNLIKVSLVLLVFWVLLFGFLQFGMSMDTRLGMVHCPLMPGHSTLICKMNPLEHIQEWQNIFISLPYNSLSLLTILALAFFVFKKFKKDDPFSISKISRQTSSFLLLNNFKLYNPIKEAYSQGILNTKIF